MTLKISSLLILYCERTSTIFESNTPDVVSMKLLMFGRTIVRFDALVATTLNRVLASACTSNTSTKRAGIVYWSMCFVCTCFDPSFI